ncbi:MAG: hybrid sensor histidine kinase/response regulator [Sedimenticola sp.]
MNADIEQGEVLVVDDNPQNLRLLANMLTEAGYHVREALNGQSALRAIRKRRPELVLLDILMPGMDGYQVCRELQADQENRDLPVIFISALDSPKDKIEGFDAGGVDYISKPFEAPEVLARVRTHITLRRHAENLASANERLKELDRLKSMFIASMSHELRTPLNAIIGFSGALLDGISGELTEEQKDDVGRIFRAGKHLLELIADVIDISKIEANCAEVFAKSVELEQVVREAVETIQPLAETKGLSLDVEADRWPRMETDGRRLLQCLLNLMSNAVKFTEQGGIRLKVVTDDRQVDLSVTDTGIGIARTDIPKLFQPFERLESRLKLKAGGTGLGLYLTRKTVVELLAGSVHVESEPGLGSTFGFVIPLKLNEQVAKR